MNAIPQLHAIENEQQARLVAAAAQADNHLALWQSHFFTVDKEIVGSVSAGTIPMFSFWSHTEKVSKRMARDMVLQAHAAMMGKGHNRWMAICPPTSPFSNHMDRWNYKLLGATELYVRD